ncbi:MAG TPA: SpoIIE family protein phosphatase [Nocardioides sp.]|nr:SpoIIE family protein phosphatase [Nocardioides sp.]
MIGETERDGLQLVTALHDVVQPAGLPVLPLFDIYGRFCVPDDAVEPGGSWFDVVVLPDDRLALVVGEVPGIGLTAAVMAAQMRGVIRAGLRRDGDAVDALHLADIHAEDIPDARGSTALIVLLDADRGIAAYASAGHPPPWLVPAEGTAVLLSDTGGGPLGTGSGTGYARATCSLAKGDGVLLAGSAVHRAASKSDEPDRILESLAAGLSSDQALSAVGASLRMEPHRGLEVRLDGEDDPVRRAREQLGSWLVELDASPMDQMGVAHAAAELVTNAFQHGANGHDPWVELRARLGSNGVALVEVLDHGKWRVPVEDVTRGRGLAMAAGLVDHLGVALRPDGTRAFLQHRLLHAAPIEVVRATARVDPDPAPVEVVHIAPHAVALRGAFGHDDVERVAAELLVATRGGTVRLSLDLREATSISTSAVQLLTDLTSVNRAVGMYAADIEILTKADSTVQRTLDSACIPHHAA